MTYDSTKSGGSDTAFDIGSFEFPEPEKEVKEADAITPSTPFEVTNADFVAAIFTTIPEGATPLICSKPGDPTGGGYPAQLPEGGVDKICAPYRNNYVNCSTFTPLEGGTVAARKDNFAAYHMLMFDDVGTKIPREKFDGAAVTYEIESSPGNSQIGIALETPLIDLSEVGRLLDAVMAAGLSDPGSSGAVRWARLPKAINGKEKYRDKGGNAPRCRLIQWNPQVRMSPQGIADALGFSLTPALAAVKSAIAKAKSTRGYNPIGDDIYMPSPAENPVVARIKEMGLYKKELGKGCHDITCPWVAEHTDQLDSGTAYFEPSRDYPVGGLKCQHSHGDTYRLPDLLKYLDVPLQEARAKPSIKLVGGEQHRIREAAELVLAEQGGFYQSGGFIVSIRRDMQSGGATIEQANEQVLATALSACADWLKYADSNWRRIDIPPRIVQLLCKSQSYEHLPVLNGIARQPYFASDGELITQAGYNEKTRIFGHFDASQFNFLEPTRENAERCLAELNALLDEFPFEQEADRVAALCAMLTATVRSSLDVAPAFNITATTSGSGKSYLSSILMPLAGPGQPLLVSYPATQDEATKIMTSLFLKNPPAIGFDDMQTDWLPHSVINRALTASTITERVLGYSKSATVSTASFIVGTGNNVRPLRDMCRRVVTIHLAPQTATPATITYKGRPVEAIRSKRAHYVSCALTIIGAWRAAGSPREDVPQIASYDQWSDMCRQPLLWLGLTDPAASLIEQVYNDPDLDLLTHLFEVWFKRLGGRPMTVRKLLKEAAERNEDLREILEELPITDHKGINPGKLGWYLGKNAGRIAGDFQLAKGDLKERNSWRVLKVGKGEAPLSPLSPEPSALPETPENEF